MEVIYTQSVFVKDSLCASQIICVCHRNTLSVTDCLCLSQTENFCHRQSVSVTDILGLSHTVFVCHRESLSATGSLCLSQTFFFIILGLILAIYTGFSSRIVREILICLGFKSHKDKLCGPLVTGGGRWTFSQNFSSRALTGWEWSFPEYLEEKADSLTHIS